MERKAITEEEKLIALYMDITGVSESQARSVFMFLEIVTTRIFCVVQNAGLKDAQ